jgi:hypothetical protein
MRKAVLFTLLIAAMFAWTTDAHAQDTTPQIPTFPAPPTMPDTPTPPNIQATLDYAATVESQDLTEIAGGESEVLTEQADEATQAIKTMESAFPSPTEAVAEVAVYQLPNAGTGNGSGGSLMLVVLVLMILATGAIAYRFRPPAR